jgi:hypothetical protein
MPWQWEAKGPRQRQESGTCHKHAPTPRQGAGSLYTHIYALNINGSQKP